MRAMQLTHVMLIILAVKWSPVNGDVVQLQMQYAVKIICIVVRMVGCVKVVLVSVQKVCLPFHG